MNTTYLNKTRDGLKIEALYMYKPYVGGGTLIAVIKRNTDWVWAWAYHPNNGTWGQGHYMFGSKAEAIADLMSEYPKSKIIRKSSLVQINTKGDTFGWSESRAVALKKVYRIAKNRYEFNPARQESFTLYSPSLNKDFAKVWTEDGRTILYSTGGKTLYRLYANGTVKKIN